jgi:hypothetical protein
MAPAIPFDKAAQLSGKFEDVSLQITTSVRKRLTWSAERDLRQLLYG